MALLDRSLFSSIETLFLLYKNVAKDSPNPKDFPIDLINIISINKFILNFINYFSWEGLRERLGLIIS
jgi:hypothetical protein